ncbi:MULTISPECIES: thiamine phosphate synthase [unclassified Isoptericola]|uniref:thiamine phosphate synthase n=1 Tax=unclassified Isoptericola TaxID=2623355 RepID=UPI002714421D|nr:MULTISPECIES: thiamine phosphate synthase [unclassified Isoptericola]MDO8143105.1 thiamine phosphate synthase [Isoptericola sp. 178]MDO8146966.1 thiamine phosphate synthase [Isoptericola sp. b515]MDO8150719.1 thiamine phosphate synthase [Isoptericola sp. b408]
METSDLRARLADARLYLCTDAREERGDLEEFLHAALRGGVDVVQLRDKTLDVARELELQALVARVATEHGALWAVNDRADVAGLTGAPVVHMGQGDLPVPAVRTLLGPAPVLGRSTHSAAQAAAAEADGDVDYFCVGPLWATPTKPGRTAVGIDLLREVARTAPTTPWFAIGGIDADRLDAVLDAGARRVVVVRAITESADPERAARTLRQRLGA